MALPQKKSRTIIINNHTFKWIASGNDGYINLIVTSKKFNGQKLLSRFGYGNDSENQFVITPSIVKSVILLGLEKGYLPEEKGGNFDLENVEEKINFT